MTTSSPSGPERQRECLAGARAQTEMTHPRTMTTPDRVYLIGPRGSGKSTVGRLLAARLGWAFADADEELEARAGRSVADVFAAEGEAGFRDREADLLR